jgi:hypothetical protein
MGCGRKPAFVTYSPTPAIKNTKIVEHGKKCKQIEVFGEG